MEVLTFGEKEIELIDITRTPEQMEKYENYPEVKRMRRRMAYKKQYNEEMVKKLNAVNSISNVLNYVVVGLSAVATYVVFFM